MAILKANQNNATVISNVYEQENGFPATATITFGTNPADGNTITLNGTVFTFRTTPSVANDVQVGADISTSIDNLLTEALPAEANYTKNGTDSFDITYATIGAVGNSYTIACDFTTVPATLSGGSDNPDGDWVDNTPSIDYRLPEIVVDGTSTNTALVESDNSIAQGDSVRLYNTTDGVVKGSLGAVTTSAGTVNTHDIFGDGSCVATYNLDSNANDLGGNHNGVIIGNAYVNFITGKYNGAISFSGRTGQYNSYIKVPNAINLIKYSTIHTVSFWVNVDNSLVQPVFSSAPSIYGAQLHTSISIRNGKLSVYNFSYDHYLFKYSNVVVPNGWHFFTIIKSGTNWDVSQYKLYCDGTEITDLTNRNDPIYGTSYSDTDLKIGTVTGTWSYQSGSFGDVSLDQVRIFNRALTSTEINTLYTEQIVKYTADISALGLTNPPTKAYKDVPVTVATVTEANANRCIATSNKKIGVL